MPQGRVPPREGTDDVAVCRDAKDVAADEVGRSDESELDWLVWIMWTPLLWTAVRTAQPCGPVATDPQRQERSLYTDRRSVVTVPLAIRRP